MQRLPGWLMFLLFVPLQVYLFVKTVDVWGFWRALLAFVIIGLVAARAARAQGLRAVLFPVYAYRWEQKRHVFQGVLFIAAALAWYFDLGPQPWLPLAIVVSAIKSALR